MSHSAEKIDQIEEMIYAYVRSQGFKRFGRTLHRFVDGDMSQVIHFQLRRPATGETDDCFWINLGIRIPECVERRFEIAQPQKKYYLECDCNIRTRLGSLADGKDTFYSLKEDPEKTGNDIINCLGKYAMPIFDVLSSRDAVLKHRAEYASFDQTNKHLILLEEAMIMGRRGETDEAARRFIAHYQQTSKRYHQALKQGTKTYLRKGERLTYHNAKTNQTETITATKNGYVTVYDANRSHLSYLENLAKELGILLDLP